jgi:hypothetical protein
MDKPKPTPEEKKLRKHLSELVAACKNHIAYLDAEVAKPSSLERGKRTAALCNSLEFATDCARHFGLGVDLETGKRPKGT